MRCLRLLVCQFIVALAWVMPLYSGVPPLLNHQGRVAANGVNFDGTGLFKFALVDADGTTTYWSNDGTSSGGLEPVGAVARTVTKGLYSILLGDTSLVNMTALPPSVFEREDVSLRVWFNDGIHGFELILPDRRLAAVPYAIVAAKVEQLLLAELQAPPIRPVLAWGKNNAGQSSVPALANVAAIRACGNRSLALLDSGNVEAWGGGPAVPGGLANVTHLAAGTSHNLARKSDGTVEGWGGDTYGQATVPSGITTARDVAAGEKHSLALLADGSVVSWGDDTFGQATIPDGLANVTAIASGYDHCLALKSDRTVVAWGRNDSGQITLPGGLADVVAIAAGAYHSLAVLGNGSVVAWGWNTGGQSTVPHGLVGAVAVAGGYAFSVALKSDGTLECWGDNTDGQTTIPSGASGITAIAAGASHVLALRADLMPAQVARLDQDNAFTGKIGILRVPVTNALEVEGQASKSTAGNWAANSDRRIKTEIRPLTNALEILDRIRLVDFRYTDAYRAIHDGIEDKRYLNVVAQEFAEIFPDHVRGSGEKLPDGSEILQVDTYPLTIYSAAAVQELHRENETLKKQLAEQEERLRRLEALMSPPSP